VPLEEDPRRPLRSTSLLNGPSSLSISAHMRRHFLQRAEELFFSLVSHAAALRGSPSFKYTTPFILLPLPQGVPGRGE